MIKKTKNFLSYLYLFLTGWIRRFEKEESIDSIANDMISVYAKSFYPYRVVNRYNGLRVNSKAVVNDLLSNGFELITGCSTSLDVNGKLYENSYVEVYKREDVLLRVDYRIISGLKYKEFIPFKPTSNGEELLNWREYLKLLNTKHNNYDYIVFCSDEGYYGDMSMSVYLKHNAKYGHGDAREWALLQELDNYMQRNLLTPMDNEDLKWLEEEIAKANEAISSILNVPTVT